MSGLEVLTILGFVKEGCEVLGKFIEIWRRYGEVPWSVMTLTHRLSGCEHALRRWERSWGLEDGRPNVYYEVVWGRSGWMEIREVVGTLRLFCGKVNEAIDNLIGCATRYNQTWFPEDVYDRRFDEELVRGSIRRIARKSRRWSRFRRACTNQAAELETQIREFNRSLRALRRIANGKFEEMHGREYSARRRHLQPRDLIRLLTGRDHRSHERARADAILLHEAYVDNDGRHPLSCYISITVMTSNIPTRRRPPAPDPSKDFQFLLKTTHNEQEVLIHPVSFNNDRGQLRRDQFHSSLSGALLQISRGHDYKCLLLPASSTFENGFQLWGVLDAQLEDLAMRPQLHTQLHRLESQREKVLLASTLVNGFFKLLGSPWGDYLECDKLRARAVGGDLWSALLDASAGNTQTTEVLDRSKRLFQRSRDVSYHCHVFRLGILLTEIAIGRRVTFLTFDRDVGPRIVLEWRGDQGLDPSRVAAEVEDEMDDTYGDIVYHCLSLLKRQDMRPDSVLDDEFARCVLQPLRGLTYV